MNTMYFVSSGSGTSHLIDTKVFNKLKDAKSEYVACTAKAKKLHSLEFPFKFEPGVNPKVRAEVKS